MDSINKNQPEDNREDLFSEEAIEKITELVSKSKTCFFCTHIETGQPFATRPMAVQDVDDNGDLWFLSADDSHKNHELVSDQHVQLLFQGSSYSDFLSLYGTTTISKDKNKIDELWNPIYKTWFTEGKDDPRITVIRVHPVDGYYWDTKNNMLVGILKRVVGAATGKTLDDSVEGKIKI
jgi:general stress protein 26